MSGEERRIAELEAALLERLSELVEVTQCGTPESHIGNVYSKLDEYGKWDDKTVVIVTEVFNRKWPAIYSAVVLTADGLRILTNVNGLQLGKRLGDFSLEIEN